MPSPNLELCWETGTPPDSRLCSDILVLVCHCLQDSTNFRLRALCQVFSASLSPAACSRWTAVRVKRLLNDAAWEGDVARMEWLFSLFQLRLVPGCSYNWNYFGEFPTAFALERGHWQVLDFLFNRCHFPPRWLADMNKSLPIAVVQGHWETVQWVVTFLEKHNSKLISKCIDLLDIKERLAKRDSSKTFLGHINDAPFEQTYPYQYMNKMWLQVGAGHLAGTAL